MKSARKSLTTTPQAHQMEVAGFNTWKTPVERSNKGSYAFQLRCESCIGIYFGKMVPDPDIKRAKPLKDNRIQRMCHFCGTGTNYFFFGCRWFLCLSPPKKVIEKDGKKDKQHLQLPKQPKYFNVKTPISNRDGDLQMNDTEGDEYKYTKEVGVWTCYHAAHQRVWKMHMQKNQSDILDISRKKRPCRHSPKQPLRRVQLWIFYNYILTCFIGITTSNS